MPFNLSNSVLNFCSLFVTKPLRLIISVVTFPAADNLFFLLDFLLLVSLSLSFSLSFLLLLEPIDIVDSRRLKRLLNSFWLLLSFNLFFNNIIIFIHFSFSLELSARKIKSRPSKIKLNSRSF